MKQIRGLRSPAAFLLALIMLFSLSSAALAATAEIEQTPPATVSDPADQSAPPSETPVPERLPLTDDDPADQSAPPSETPAPERLPLTDDDPAEQSAPPATGETERLPLTEEDLAEQSAPPSETPAPERLPQPEEDPWAQDQSYTLADPAPWDLDELKRVVDVTDPRSVAAYWVWAVMRLGENYDDGMAMMKYLYADIELFDSGYTEGGVSGRAGWDTYFNSRLTDPDYNWLPRSYFEGADKSNGFALSRPLRIWLTYDKVNTEAANATTLAQFGRENYIYRVKSNAGGNEVSITASKFAGSNRWYVTNGGASSTTLFYDQRWALTAAELNLAKATGGDTSTADEHLARYSGEASDTSIMAAIPFDDVSSDAYYCVPVIWAYQNNVTKGTGDTTFGPDGICTRGQVVTFLWRAAGCPAPQSTDCPFTDLTQDWYKDAVLWAVEKGITNGTSATTFSPDQQCSSAVIITFLYRACGGVGSGWYEVARDWAAEASLLDDTGLIVSPDELCPRSAVVTFLYRFYH